MILPAVYAGDAANPEMTDPAGDAPGPVDVTAAWFESLPDPLVPVTTGLPEQCVTPGVAGTFCVDVDCDLIKECRKGFRVYVQLADLLAKAQPLADEDPLSTRFYYDISFNPSNWGTTVTIRCLINYVELLRTGDEIHPAGSPGETWSVGRRCYYPATGQFDHDAYIILNSGSVRTGNTFFVTLLGDLAPVETGVELRDLSVATAIGGLQTPDKGPLLKGHRLADKTETPGSTYTIP